MKKIMSITGVLLITMLKIFAQEMPQVVDSLQFELSNINNIYGSGQGNIVIPNANAYYSFDTLCTPGMDILNIYDTGSIKSFLASATPNQNGAPASVIDTSYYAIDTIIWYRSANYLIDQEVEQVVLNDNIQYHNVTLYRIREQALMQSDSVVLDTPYMYNNTYYVVMDNNQNILSATAYYNIAVTGLFQEYKFIYDNSMQVQAAKSRVQLNQLANKLANNGITIYPDPAQNNYNVSFNVPSDQPITMTITDVAGAIVQRQIISNVSKNVSTVMTFSTQNLAPQMYYAHFQNNDINVTTKFVVIK